MKKLLLFILLCVYFSLLSHAEDRALLIGVGEYKNNIKNLPGVLLDIETMRDSAQILGFENKNIKILLNDQATLNNVKNTIKTWLIDGTSVDDKVLIYFSGHGSRIPDLNNDENDGADEVLVLYDSKVVIQNRKKTLSNALVDDEFGLYLQQIKSRDLMLLVDACNSGTIYRGLSLGNKQVTGKFFNYAGMPQSKSIVTMDDIMAAFSPASKKNNKSMQQKKTTAGFIDAVNTDDENKGVIQKPTGFRFIAITAAGDDELALTTKKGSIFTQGLNFYLKQAAINHQQLTPKQLIDKLSLYIEKKVQQEKLGAVFQPQLAGNIDLVNKAISLIDSPQAKINWNRLESLDISNTKLMIKASKKQLSLGESIELNIFVPEKGYLNIITVGPDDEVFILYPNPWEPKNLVGAGNLHLPTKKMDFEIKLTEPLGKNLMLAVLTSEPINLYRQSTEGRDRSGRMFNSLKILAQSAEKTLQSNSDNKALYLSGQVIIEVK